MTVLGKLFSFLAVGRYNSTLPTVPNGIDEYLQVDERGRVLTSNSKPRGYVRENALAKQGTIFTGAGSLLEAIGCNQSTSGRYFMLFDKASAASGGDTPVERFWVAGSQNFVYTPYYPIAFTNGCVWAFSTTIGTLTLTGTNDCFINACYL